MSDFTARPLIADEWTVYRDLRLEALQTEPQAYPADFSTENGFTEKQWRRRTASTVAQSFVLLCGKKPVGIGTLVKLHDDTGLICHNYTQPEHRGKNGGPVMDLARLRWAFEQGLSQITAMPCQANEKSHRRLEACGFACQGQIVKATDQGRPETLMHYQGNTAEIICRLQETESRAKRPDRGNLSCMGLLTPR